ncbi:hypothetical protein A9Q81_26405 [Gammaproteobacteria bacterium 42_54_T18]|nr:hypothetical protein A9Q81_26405 [Gammaproteobacteria bacterium 42_54_T18]
MKRNLLALAVGAAVAMPGVALADAATIYGRMDLSLGRVTIDKDDSSVNEDGSNWEVNSHASRFGVKGDADLGNGLKAIYKIEWQVSGDEGTYSKTTTYIDDAGDSVTVSDDSGDLKARNRYVGLTGDFGAVMLGKMDTPMKKSQGKVDQFDNYGADIARTIMGDVRASNVLAVSSPKVADALTFSVALIPGEENDVDDSTDTNVEDGLADAWSGSVVFTSKVIYAAFAIDDNVAGWDTYRGVAQISAGNVKLGAVVTVSEQNSDSETGVDADEKTGLVLSVAIPVSKKITLKGQVGSSKFENNEDGVLENEIKQASITVGADYNFTKQTKAYAFIDSYAEDSDIPDATATQVMLSLGMQHKF